jgi:hypothetical protein
MRLLQLVGWGMLAWWSCAFPDCDGRFFSTEAFLRYQRELWVFPFVPVSFLFYFLQGITILFLLVHSAFFLDRGESLNNGILVNEGLAVS